ncbi:mitochondrial basic amino acids transporter [Agrilus planipennis]|uniref:Mitochondrial basic amino acids transporter n=1 Tax=Agrilus planipennis TaxID=224129 RepID=A0A1W4XAY3_AGRPL|nr:mitochondrial basic amino acids transporter [Agrilus planipennis]
MALDFFAGCLGGCAGVIVGHPFDTVKVILQTQMPNAERKYAGTVDCVKSLMVREGLRGLYRGVSSPLAGVAGINAVVFGVYGNVQRAIGDSNSALSHILAGSVAGLVQSVLCGPMELVKSRLQVSSKHMGIFECLKRIYDVEGRRGLFRGLSMTVARDVPAFGIYFASYEAMTRSDDNTSVSVTKLLLAGGLAGMFSWIVFPVDVIKSRIQVDGLDGKPLYKNSWNCYLRSTATEGYRCLFRGFPIAILRAFPVNAACFTVVALTLRLFDQDKTHNEKNIVYNYGTDKNVFMPNYESSLMYATL